MSFSPIFHSVPMSLQHCLLVTPPETMSRRW
jgi:hypothetical protein